jgi:hypothetical protein
VVEIGEIHCARSIGFDCNQPKKSLVSTCAERQTRMLYLVACRFRPYKLDNRAAVDSQGDVFQKRLNSLGARDGRFEHFSGARLNE